MNEVKRYSFRLDMTVVDYGQWIAASDYDSLQSCASALAEAISQYLEALLKPDHTALTTRHLYSALKDYQDFMGTEKQDK